MKKILLLSMGLLAFAGVQAQRNCAASNHLHAMEATHPEVKQNRLLIEQHTQQYIQTGGHTRAVVTIPVVVHVLYNNTTTNISDAQINSQIAVLNADFSKTNSDISLVPSGFTASAGNPDIQFCLAQRTPSGAATTGIVRVSTTKSVFDASLDDAKSSSTGGSNAWDASKYLNVWVVPSIKDGSTTGILGYAQFPGGPSSTDGVVCGYNYFGTVGTLSAPFNKGRTMTHEVGHYLNLYHIWGDDDINGVCSASTECSGSDLVGDTPNQCIASYGCPSYPKTDGCTSASPGIMYMNYMDYTDDACMFMFSNGQVSRMQALFGAGGSRVSLLTSQGCVPPNTTTCGTPASLSAGSITQTSAVLSWGAAANATSYNVSYKTSSATTYSTPVSVTGTSYSLSGLTAGTTYNWKVSATCASGTSPEASSTFTTSSVTPTCTDNYEANETRTAGKTIAVNTNITAKISSATDKDYFKFTNTTATKNIKIDLTNLPADYDVRLYRGATQVGISQNASTSAEQIKYNNGTVTTYYVYVYGYNGVFNANSCYTLRASLSATAFRNINGEEVEVEENINLEKIQGDLDLSIVPNPSNGNVQFNVLNLTGSNQSALVVYDVTGKAVYQNQAIAADQGNSSLDVQLDLPNGIYQAILTIGESRVTQKLMINK
jgi:hypothetical protein